MAYGETLNPNRRAATLAAVTAIHLALGYALVIGLKGTGIPFIDKPIKTTFTPKDPPPPTPTPSASERTPLDPLPVPSPTFTFAPPDTPFTPLPPSPLGFDGGVGEALFPTPTPRPLSSFTPVGLRPLGNQKLWVTPDDYPTTDLRLGHEGLTRLTLTVGLSGRVENCTVTASSGFASLDAAACAKLTQRAKFKPGADSTGALAGGRYATSVRWEIPPER